MTRDQLIDQIRQVRARYLELEQQLHELDIQALRSAGCKCKRPLVGDTFESGLRCRCCLTRVTSLEGK